MCFRSEMAVYSLNSYLSKVSQAWQVGEGDDLAALLSFQVGNFLNTRIVRECSTWAITGLSQKQQSSSNC